MTKFKFTQNTNHWQYNLHNDLSSIFFFKNLLYIILLLSSNISSQHCYLLSLLADDAEFAGSQLMFQSR